MLKHIISQTLKGKTINRILMNAELRPMALSGQVLDLGAGKIRSSYFSFLGVEKMEAVTSIDKLADRKPDLMADLEEKLPLLNDEYDFVLCFNLLEHIYHHQQLLAEVIRVLKSGGKLVGYVPFLVKFHPDPDDFFRYTEQGLKKLFQEAGFNSSEVKFIGRGALTAAWSQMEYVLPRFLRWIVTFLVFGLDALLLKFKPVFRKKYPLGYVFIAQK